MAELLINNFQKGIGESAYVGFADMRNVDIFSAPGAVKISNALIPYGNSSSVVTGLIVRAVQDPSEAAGVIYYVDNVGTLYKSISGGFAIIAGHGVAGAKGQGLAIWNHYLFYIRDTRIDLYALPSSPNGDAGTWYLDWKAVAPYAVPYDLDTSFGYNLHPAFSSGQRFVLYIGNGHFVDQLQQVAGQVFNPNNTATWTYLNKDLILGSDYRVTTLAELSGDIAIGTLVGFTGGVVNIGDTFYWDGFSDFIAGGKTVSFAENGVWQMKNMGNILYTIAGTGRTRLFQSTYSQGQEIKRLNNLNGNLGASSLTLAMFTSAIDSFNGELLFGVSASGNLGINPLGLYTYRNRAYTLRNTISTGSYGAVQGVEIGVVISLPEAFVVSYYDIDANTYGVDVLATTYYSNYKAVIDSPVYTPGTDDDPVTFEKCEIRLGKALKYTDKVRISARQDLDSAFTVITEFDTIAEAGLIGKSVIDKSVKNLGYFKDIQVRIELTTDAAEFESPELLSVKLQ